MADTFEYQGATYRRNPDGSATRVQTAPRAVPIGPPDQKFPIEVRQGQVNIPNTQANTQRTRVQTQGDMIDNSVKGRTAPDIVAKTRADRLRAEAEAQVAQRAANNPTLTDDQRKVLQTRATLETIVPRLNRAQELYQQDVAPETVYNLFGLADLFSSPATGRFDTVGEQIADLGLNAFRTPGVGAQSDYEAKAFAAANKPNTSNWDSSIEEKFSNMRTRVDNNRRALGMQPAMWAGRGADNPALTVEGARNAQREGLAAARRAAGPDPAKQRAAAERYLKTAIAKRLAQRSGPPRGWSRVEDAPRNASEDPELDALMSKYGGGR